MENEEGKRRGAHVSNCGVRFFHFPFYILLLGLSSCLGPRTAPQWVYFPAPPDPPRVVHLVSFNGLHELVPPRESWVGLFRGAAAGPLVGTPMGLAWRGETLYICDTNVNYVHAWNLASGATRRIGADGELTKPVAVAVDEHGTVFVADTIRGEVVAFEQSGSEIRRFRPPKTTNYRPVAVAVARGALYVADMANHSVDVYSTETGRWLRFMGGRGSSRGRTYYPAGISVDAAGQTFVADMMNARVQVFDSSGHFSRAFGSPGNRYGSLGTPKDIAVGPDGISFVADAQFGCVHLFDPDGRVLMVIGGPRDEPGGTPLPNGIAIAAQLPEKLLDLVPDGFETRYYVWVSNTTGQKRLALFAVGSGAPLMRSGERATNPRRCLSCCERKLAFRVVSTYRIVLRAMPRNTVPPWCPSIRTIRVVYSGTTVLVQRFLRYACVGPRIFAPDVA